MARYTTIDTHGDSSMNFLCDFLCWHHTRRQADIEEALGESEAL